MLGSSSTTRIGPALHTAFIVASGRRINVMRRVKGTVKAPVRRQAAVGPGDRAEPGGDWASGVRTNVSRSTATSPNCGLVALGPLEVVEQRPVEVAAHVEAVVEAAADALERLGDVRDARARRRRCRCRSRSRTSGTPVTSAAWRIDDLERLRPVLVAHRLDDRRRRPRVRSAARRVRCGCACTPARRRSRRRARPRGTGPRACARARSHAVLAAFGRPPVAPSRRVRPTGKSPGPPLITSYDAPVRGA